MSFILDQLKKSGKQREIEMAMRTRQGKTVVTPAPAAAQSSGPESRLYLRPVNLIVFATVLLGVGLYAGLHYRGKPVLRQTAVRPEQLSAMHKTDSQRPSGESNVRPPVLRGHAASSAVKPEPAGSRLDSSSPEKETPEIITAAQPLSPAPTYSDEAGRVKDIKQLPALIRKGLPEIRITSHLFRKDSRLVSINGRIMSEGFNMDDGLYLEEITPEGVVLSFRGHRFSVRAD